jgi:uncharacterized protein (TIGR03437 family)
VQLARALRPLFFLSISLIPPVFSQSVFVLPSPTTGQADPDLNAASYDPSTLTVNGQFKAGTGAYRVISTADGSKFYVLSNDPQMPLYSVSGDFATVKPLSGVYSGITQATLLPDGSQLYVISGGALVGYATNNDTVIPLPAVPSNTAVADIDGAVDASQIFAILTSSLNNTFEAISASTHKVTQTMLLPMIPSAVTVGPNGLVYVSGANTILEIDPNSYQILHQYSITATPGKLAFTPDGHYALANNLASDGTVAVTAIDLQSHSVAGTIPSTALPPGTTINAIWPINSTIALGYVQATQKIYNISLSPLGISSNGLLPTSKPIVALALSGDIASSAHPSTQNLFFSTSNTLQRLNLTTGLVEGGTFTSSQVAALSYTSPALKGVAAELLPYGANQQLAPGSMSQPIVVRAVDSAGNPLSGIAVTFQAPAGATLAKTSVTTNMLGFASTTFTAPATTGAISVSAQAAGGVTAIFSAGIGNAGGGNGVPASLTVIEGQGMLAPEATNITLNGPPLTVQVKDAAGNPVPYTPVTFTLTSGLGSLVLHNYVGTSPKRNVIVVPTDKDGLASVEMVTASVSSQYPYFDSEVITAQLPSGISTPIYVTTVAHKEPATIQLLSPLPGTVFKGAAGTTVKNAFQFRIFSNSGPGLSNVSLRLIPSGDPATTPSASCAGPPLSDSQGLVSCDLVFGGIVGQAQVTPEVGYYARSLATTIQVTPGGPGKFVQIQGDGQTGKPNQNLPLGIYAVLEDSFGNVLPNTPVTWAVTSGSATIRGSSNQTDKTGTTWAYLTLGPIPGPVQLTVSAGPANAPVVSNFTANVVVTPGGLKLVSGDNQTADVGAAFGAPLVVQALDDSNQPVQGVNVAFDVTSGGAALSSPSAVTDAQGNASVTATAPAAAGDSVVTATYGGFSASFTLKAVFPGPANVAFLNGASFVGAGPSPGAISPGEIVTITGDHLAPGVDGVLTPPAGPLPTTLGGVQVLFGGIAAPLYAVVNQNGQEQINALVPFELGSATTTSVTIINSSSSGTILNVPVQPLSPGFFSAYYNNQSYAVMVRASDGKYIGPTNMAKPGDTVIAFVNGLGQGSPVIGSTLAGEGQVVNGALTITVNGVSVGDVSAVYQAQAYGIYLVTFRVPDNLQPGLYPLTLSEVGPDSNTYAAASSFIMVGE